MPHLSGVFDEFPDLEKASIEQLMSWVSQKVEVHFLVNLLGNRILYPQTIPLTKKEMELDLAILKAGVRMRPGLVFAPQTNRIIIPKQFAERFFPLGSLVKSLIEGINPKGIHVIYIKDNSQLKMVGSVISPLNPQKLSQDERTVFFSTNQIKKILPLNQISIVPSTLADAKIMLGGEEFKALGGQLGVIVDLRLGGFG